MERRVREDGGGGGVGREWVEQVGALLQEQFGDGVAAELRGEVQGRLRLQVRKCWVRPVFEEQLGGLCVAVLGREMERRVPGPVLERKNGSKVSLALSRLRKDVKNLRKTYVRSKQRTTEETNEQKTGIWHEAFEQIKFNSRRLRKGGRGEGGIWRTRSQRRRKRDEPRREKRSDP